MLFLLPVSSFITVPHQRFHRRNKWLAIDERANTDDSSDKAAPRGQPITPLQVQPRNKGSRMLYLSKIIKIRPCLRGGYVLLCNTKDAYFSPTQC